MSVCTMPSGAGIKHPIPLNLQHVNNHTQKISNNALTGKSQELEIPTAHECAAINIAVQLMSQMGYRMQNHCYKR